MKSCHFYRIAQCSSKNSMTLSSFSMTFEYSTFKQSLCYFPWLSRPGKWSSYFPWLSITRGYPVNVSTGSNADSLSRKEVTFSFHFVRLFVCYQHYAETTQMIFTEFVENVAYGPRKSTRSVDHPTTNRAQCRATALIDTNALLLH